jgi:hypothetical protein
MIHFLGPLLAKRSLATQRVAAQAAECGHERGAAQCQAANAENDDRGLPQVAMLVHEREIEFVKAVV